MEAADAQGNALSYTLVGGVPAGMTVNSSTGLISWTPSVSQLGSFSVTVQASNSAGQTSQSYTGTVVAPKPTTPNGFILDAVGGDSALLSWNASTDPSGGLSYGVYHVTAGAHHTTVYTLMGTTTKTSITLTGLTPGFSYLLTVKATDSAGRTSGYSNSYYAKTQDAPALYSPIGTSINVTAKHPVTIDLAALGATPADSRLCHPQRLRVGLSVDPDRGDGQPAGAHRRRPPGRAAATARAHSTDLARLRRALREGIGPPRRGDGGGSW